MKEMRIIIPTKGRTSVMLTANSLIGELMKKTTIVCPEREVGHYLEWRNDVEVVAQPDPNWGIAQKRGWILEEWLRRGYDKIVMLDDDLRFATRKSKSSWQLKEIVRADLVPEFKRLEDKLGPEFPHVGFGPRQGNQTLKEVGWKSPGKMCYVLAFYLPIVVKECVFNRVRTREDMDISLQLLRKGYPNALWTETVVDQRRFDAPGGTHDERTMQSSNEDCYTLAALHPGLVSVVDRDYEASVPRKEVIVQWGKALEEGRQKLASNLST